MVPVGSNTPVTVDVRFVCATNRIPAEEVAAGRFREDLYYRLHVVPIHMPPLKDRGRDVLEIARHMLTEFSAEEDKHFVDLSEDARARLLAHGWPGNVRELGNVIQSAVVLNDNDLLTADMLSPVLGNMPAEPSNGAHYDPGRAAVPAATLAPMPAPEPMFSGGIEPLAVVERRAIERAITLSGGRVRAAAKALEVNPSTLYRKLSAWEAGEA